MKRKIIILVFVLALSSVAQAQTTYIVLAEDFEGLTLGPSPEEAAGTPGVWTDTPPPGWIVDDSGVPGAGDPATDGVTDWAGWAFADKDFWISTDGQRREEFVLGRGAVAVADCDEWDDNSHAGGSYNAYFSTPAIDISRSKAGTMQLKFDSSWRPEVTQTGNITVSYDGGSADEVLRWESQAGAYFKDDNSTNETIIIDLDNPPGAQSMVLTFGLFNAGNNWWWAIDNIMVTAVPRLEMAYNPNPLNRAPVVPLKTVLSWTPGDFVGGLSPKHKVILGDNFDYVKNGTAVVTTQDSNSFDPAGLIDFGTTYYWRIDEANSTTGWDEGSVWQFTVEPIANPIDDSNITATASSMHKTDTGPENTINGSGLDANDLHSMEATDMWLSSNEPLGAWIEYELNKVYKLHEMCVWNSNQLVEALVGFGLKDVTIEYSTNGTDYTRLGTTHEFTRAPGTPDYAFNTTVDFGGAPAKYVRLTANSNWGGILPQYGLSEVRFFTIPVHAKEPYPDSGTIDVAVDVALGWKAGREAVTHDVSLSSDEQAVIDGTVPVITVTGTSYGPLSLDLNMTYYWKINEVNEAETTTTWQGDIWNFKTREFFVVDDFEDYNDYPPDEIFSTWIDGWEVPTNGSLAGHADPPFAETTIVHGGGQSMPFFYDNTGAAAYSEGERTFAVPQDWTAAGVQTLTLWFHGTAGNTGQLYVEVNGSKVVYDGDAADMQRAWQPWNIELASFGVNLQNVTTLAIGIDGNGASGTLYFDDIRLYPYSRQFITPAEPSNAGLIGHWKFDGNTLDHSGLGNDGTANGVPTYAVGKVGQAMSFDGTDDYVAIDGVADDITSNDITLAAWVNMTADDDWYPVISCNTASGGNEGWLAVDEGYADFGPVTGTMFVTDNDWHHLAYTRIGDSGSLYVDGVLEGTHTTSLNFSTSSNLWSIGQEWDGGPVTSDFFTGTVDDVRIYDYALSHAEVAWLAGRTLPFDKPF